VFNGCTFQERDCLLRQSTLLSCHILFSKDTVELTARVVARRVLFFLPRDPIVRVALAIFKQPDANDKEVVPKEPQSTIVMSLLPSPLFLFVDRHPHALLYAEHPPNLVELILTK
jgi:hypothetical protein